METYITPTLHSAVHWFLKLDVKNIDELMNTLNKVRTEPNEAMLAGLKFEDDVVAFQQNGTLSGNEAYNECVTKVSNIIGKNALWQEVVCRDVQTSQGNVFLYGKADAINRDWIYDVKFSKKYEIGKYADSIQHLVYMYCTGIEKFAYVVSNGKEVWREDYFWSDEAERTLLTQCDSLMRFLNCDAKIKEAYYENWKFKGDKRYAVSA